MYNILIVDDEKIERNGIKYLLGKLNEEFDIIEASNGKQALEYIKENEIDILLTDIKMPFMDGLELITEVSRLYPKIKAVIFSGFNEFEYAKSAVKLGVVDYILKPVDPSEFDNTMDKVLKELEEERIDENIMSKSLEFLKEHMLYLLTTGADIKEIEKYGKGLIPDDFADRYSIIMLLEFNSDFFGKNDVGFKEKILGRWSSITDILNLNPQQELFFFEEEPIDIVDMASKIQKYIMKEYGQECFIAISSKFKGGQNISEAMDEVENLIENKFYHQSCNVFYPGMKYVNDEVIKFEDDTLMKQMKQDLRMKDIISLNEHFNKFCEKYRMQTDFSQVYIKFLFSNLLKDITSCLSDNEKELDSEIEQLYRSSDFDTVMGIVSKNIDKLKKVFDSNSQTVHREVEKAKNYIREHFGEEIMLDQLAGMINITPSYLSSVFKKETGVNFSKYINDVRMEQAKDMLDNTALKIVQISEKCGFHNVSYFCTTFKGYYGITPQKFRDTVKQESDYD